MKLTNNKSIKFNGFLPIYNWLYPLSGYESENYKGSSFPNVFNDIKTSKSRALYFHIPFCETICTFCPFVRTGIHENKQIDEYVDALIKEIELKSNFIQLTSTPISAIFFGGGTPSMLNENHILRIGESLHKYFDLSKLKEFSFEFEVKSITAGKIEALKQIGVTHARFGLQTFSPKYRDIFNLTATMEQVHNSCELLKNSFTYVSCDIIFGMNGQSEIEVFDDISLACKLGLNNIDVYPINNLVTQKKLHQTYRTKNLLPTSGLTKHYMNQMIRSLMAEHGYLPHNGHGYVKVDSFELSKNPVTTEQYSFIYHEHVYGYQDFDLLGFGVNAVSSFTELSISNTSSIAKYINSIKKNVICQNASKHDIVIDACRPLALALPYHGRIKKNLVHWKNIPSNMNNKLKQLIQAELIEEDNENITLTHDGWNWYSNIMYYLLPDVEQRAVDSIIKKCKEDSSRDIEKSGLEMINLKII